MIRYEPKILEGTPVRAGTHRAITAVLQQADGYQHRCGGIAVAPRWVLTAAHCVVSRDGEPVDGLWTLTDHVDVRMTNPGPAALRRQGRLVHVTGEPVTPPGFDPATSVPDLALLRLARKLDPGRVWSGGYKGPSSDRPVSVFGWGVTEQGRRSDLLLESRQLDVLGDKDCQESYGELPDHVFCAGSKSSGACDFDSGGPLLEVKSEGSLVGIASAHLGGHACGTPHDLYTAVVPYEDWISETIGGG